MNARKNMNITNDKKLTRIRHIRKYKYFILLPDDPIRGWWELFVMLLLLATFVFTPYKIAFVDDDSTYWNLLDSAIDFLFVIDIVLNFFMAYYDPKYILIDSRWVRSDVLICIENRLKLLNDLVPNRHTLHFSFQSAAQPKRLRIYGQTVQNPKTLQTSESSQVSSLNNCTGSFE